MQEFWKPIEGARKYEVSTLGRVRSKAGVLTQQINQDGYMTISLRYDDGITQGPAYVHRLVLCAHAGDQPAGMQGCHNDGDKTNNCLPNLRWDTRAGNMKDKLRHGTVPVLPRRLTPQQVKVINDMQSKGWSGRKIAKRLNLPVSTIAKFLRRKKESKHIVLTLAHPKGQQVVWYQE